MAKYRTWVYIFVVIISVGPFLAHAQGFDPLSVGSKAWDLLKGFLSDPWSIFTPLKALRFGDISPWDLINQFKDFVYGFNNYLHLSPGEILNWIRNMIERIVN